LYLDWYVHVPKVKYDFRSSGLSGFSYKLTLGDVNLSENHLHGNPECVKVLARRYRVKSENVSVSSEGASGQNARVIRCLAERNSKRDEAVVEYPAYEPLLRLVQEYFPRLKRLDRRVEEQYRLDADALRKVVSERTGLLVLTNPHAPSSAISDRRELLEVMEVAAEFGFPVLCDEIYAEFSRETIPSVFSVEPSWGIVTTSFTKAYGLGGLRAGVAIGRKELVDELCTDMLNTVGVGSNVVEIVAMKLLTEGKEASERHKEKWTRLRKETEQWLDEKGLEYFPNRVGVTYWVKLPVKDTYSWVNNHAIPDHSLAPVPGTFFLFRNEYKLERSNMIRLGLGNINPDGADLTKALKILERAVD